MKRSISQGVILTALLFMVFCGLYVSRPASAADNSDVEEFVTRFYELCLSRGPDSAGLDGWVSALINGTKTGSDVANGFVFSQEFINKNTTNEEYLQVLYEAFFNRQPDPAGLQGWFDALAGGSSREDVLNGFIYATEFAELCEEYAIIAFKGHTTKAQKESVKAFVTRFYQLCLDRDPDAVGLEGWANNLLNQVQTGADVAGGFIYSQEFINKNTTNDEYLTVLYKAFFNRDPDQAGWDGWLSEFNAGKNRDEVLDGFIYSAEFSNLSCEYGINAFSGSVPCGDGGDGNDDVIYSANGTYIYDSNRGTLILNITDSKFPDSCSLGVGVEEKDVSVGATTMIWYHDDDQSNDIWSRENGTSNDIVGTWELSPSEGGIFELTLNSDGSFTVVATNIQCDDDDDDDDDVIYSANGTYIYDSNSGTLILNITDSKFPDSCSLGVGVEEKDVSVGATTMIWYHDDDQSNDIWSRENGTSNDIVGTWELSPSEGGIFELTLNSDGSFTGVATNIQCDDGDTIEFTIPIATIDFNNGINDWDSIPPALLDEFLSATSTDIEKVYLSIDSNNLYVRMDLGNTPFSSGEDDYQLSIKKARNSHTDYEDFNVYYDNPGDRMDIQVWVGDGDTSVSHYPTYDSTRFNIIGNSIQFSIPLSDINNPDQMYLVFESRDENENTVDETDWLLATFSPLTN